MKNFQNKFLLLNFSILRSYTLPNLTLTTSIQSDAEKINSASYLSPTSFLICLLFGKNTCRAVGTDLVPSINKCKSESIKFLFILSAGVMCGCKDFRCFTTSINKHRC